MRARKPKHRNRVARIRPESKRAIGVYKQQRACIDTRVDGDVLHIFRSEGNAPDVRSH